MFRSHLSFLEVGLDSQGATNAHLPDVPVLYISAMNKN